jgi:hypothetical protein
MQRYRFRLLSRFDMAFLLVASVFVALGAASVSCTKNTRIDTIKAAYIAVDASWDGLIAWDRATASAIIQSVKARGGTREQAEAELAEHRKRFDEARDTFRVVYKALSFAATQTDDPSLSTAIAASTELVKLVDKLRGKQ